MLYTLCSLPSQFILVSPSWHGGRQWTQVSCWPLPLAPPLHRPTLCPSSPMVKCVATQSCPDFGGVLGAEVIRQRLEEQPGQERGGQYRGCVHATGTPPHLWFSVSQSSAIPLFNSPQFVARCNMHRFGEVQAHRTSSNLLELHPHRDSKVYRVLLHEFGVVRLDRTFSDYIFTGDRRSAGCYMH